MLKIERVGDYDHAAIGIDDTSVGFDAMALAGVRVPLEADRNARIHAPTAALFVKARAKRFNIAGFYRHTCPMKAMLELREATVNGTHARVGTKE